MKIVMPGGSGQVGAILGRAFQREGHEVVVLSRRPAESPWRVVQWDGATLGAWSSEVDGCDVVINLAGRSVNCRYTAANRKDILESRVFSTRVVGQAISTANRPPRVWLQASTATIYSHSFDEPNDEMTGSIGGWDNAPGSWAFSTEVARAWESALAEAVTPHTRKVTLRSSMTMSADPGGIFATLLRLVRCGLGGSIAGGRQYVSWIHEDDFVAALAWLIETDWISGAVNVCAPNPLPQREFMRDLRHAAGIPIGLPATKLMASIGALLMQTETELILKSRRVVPGRLLDRGFAFKYPNWPDAAVDLYNRWKAR